MPIRITKTNIYHNIWNYQHNTLYTGAHRNHHIT